MKDFPVTATAFSGYALLVKKPAMTFWWFVFSLAVSLISLASVVLMVGPQLTALHNMRAAGQIDPASMLAVTRQMGGYQAFSIVFALLTTAMTLGAANRMVLKPAKASFGSLRIGADEFRLLLVAIVIGVVVFAAFFVVVIATVAVGAMSNMAGVLRGVILNQAAMPTTAIVRLIVVPILGLIVIVFLLTKFSLSGAQTVGESAIRIFESWSLTKGRFWKILGTLVLAYIPTLIVEGVILVVYLQLVASGPLTGGFMQITNNLTPDVSSLGAAFSGPHLLAYVLLSLARTVGMAGGLVPLAVIYQAIAPGDGTEGYDDDDDDDDEDEDD